MPRNLEEPGYFANYGLIPEHDRVLTHWMRSRLRLAVWVRDRSVVLRDLETDVLRALKPPLNLERVATPWRRQVKLQRALMAAEARTWAGEHGTG